LHQSQCPLAAFDPFLRLKKCPSAGCGVTPIDVLVRAEQKLVDTMLVADLVHLSSGGAPLIVVSSDDDLWPGIESALLRGARVVQVQTLPGRFTPAHYVSATPLGFTQVSL
jgi:hypothetical protein